MPEVSNGITHFSECTHAHGSQPVPFECQWIAACFWGLDSAMVLADPALSFFMGFPILHFSVFFC